MTVGNRPRTIRHAGDAVSGIAEVIAVWGMLGVDAIAIYRLYARPATPPGMPRRPAGPLGGVRQLLVFCRHPASPIAVAMLPITLQRLSTRDRLPVAVGSMLVSGAIGPRVVRAARDVAPVGFADAIASACVGGSLTMALGAVWRGGVRPIRPWTGDGAAGGSDRFRLALGTGLVLHGLPWILADAGVYVGDVPLLGRLFLSRDVPSGGRGPAVHLGHHHGLDGTLVALAALALSRTLPDVRPPRVRAALSAYLAMLLVYGTMRAVEDGWHEQVVKRGWTRRRLPAVVAGRRPVRPWLWVGMAGAATAVRRTWGRD